MKPLTSAIPALLLSLAGSAAIAQSSDHIIPDDRAFPVTPNMISGGQGVMSPNPYAPRVDADVYNVGLPSETGGSWAGGGSVVYDDVRFGGPYMHNANPIVINRASIGFITPATLPPPHGDHLWTRISFYPDHDNTVPGTAFPYSGTPVVAILDWGSGWNSGLPNTVTYYPATIAFNQPIATLSNANVFNGGPGDLTAGVKIEIFADAAATLRATEWSVARRANHTALMVGTTDSFAWFSNGADALAGEVQNANRSGGATARATYLGFGAPYTGCGFPCPWYSLGALPDGLTTTSSTLPDNAVKWYSAGLVAPATDDAGADGQFLDLDTEGSAAQVAIALYYADPSSPSYGSLLLTDSASGSGTQSQLSFGIGRRAAIGDGRQYDGRGYLPGFRGLPAGPYLVAVAPAGSAFNNDFNVTPTGPGGPFTLRLRTNVHGTPSQPSVAPPVDVALGSVVGTAIAPPAFLDQHDVRWVSFTTPLSASPDRAVTISLEPVPLMVNSSITLFNSSGNVVASSVSLTPTPAAPLTFNTPGSLPAGDYLAAITYGERDLSTNPATAGRWHVRSTTQNNGFAFALRVQTAWTSLCGPSDFDGDGDSGTDADIEAFFRCLAGDCCPTCWELGIDFDGNGDSGTDADIEAFFRVLAGGPC